MPSSWRSYGTVLRFSWSVQRNEFLALLLGGIVLLAGVVWQVILLSSQAPASDCFLPFLRGTSAPAGCRAVESFFRASHGLPGQLGSALAVSPAVIGLLLGAPLVSREVERGTAETIWAIAGSRRRWLMDRLVPTIAVALVLSSILAVTADLLAAARLPYVDIERTFVDYGSRGLPLVARAIAFTSLCVLAGTVFGRQLLAVLVGACAIGALLVAMKVATPFGAQLAPVDYADPVQRPLPVTEVFLASDGSFLTREEALLTAPADLSEDEAEAWVYENVPSEWLGVPGARLAEVETREAILLGCLSVVFVVASAEVCLRRRPY